MHSTGRGSSRHEQRKQQQRGWACTAQTVAAAGMHSTSSSSGGHAQPLCPVYDTHSRLWSHFQSNFPVALVRYIAADFCDTARVHTFMALSAPTPSHLPVTTVALVRYIAAAFCGTAPVSTHPLCMIRGPHCPHTFTPHAPVGVITIMLVGNVATP